VSQSSLPLPTFDRPPLVETVLSVQFEPQRKITNAHLGAFWARHRDSWPEVQHRSPIEPNSEVLGEAGAWLPRRLQLTLSQNPETRLQLVNQQQDRMLQIQNGRLVYNWRRGANPYPRFSTINQEFTEVWTKFHDFIQDEGFPAPVPTQWEVVYVNHVDRGELWQHSSDWADLVPGMFSAMKAPESIATPESWSGQRIFRLKDDYGRLYVDAIPHFADEVERLVLRLTARGPTTGNDKVMTYDLNLGHESIVLMFDALISDKARRHWGRK
jgi:uncharacterized protein (TIGR04255 family)